MDNLYKETKYILNKYGIQANKSLGQNFLINEEVVDTIISKADINKEDLVIEIGPGLGTLTSKLLEKAGRVICIELDNRMIQILNDRFKLYNNFELIHDDILKVDLNNIINKFLAQQNNCMGLTLGRPVTTEESTKEYTEINNSKTLKNAKIVANLPYYITTPIIMKLLEEKINVQSITVMIQKEVADRLVEIPGGKNAGAITYSVYYYAEAEKVIDVENNSFIPEPNVKSTVIKLINRNEPPVSVKDKELMFKIIKQAFMQRRKTLVNAFSNLNMFNSKEDITNMIKEIGIDEKIRGEALTLEQYAKIADNIKNNI